MRSPGRSYGKAAWINPCGILIKLKYIFKILQTSEIYHKRTNLFAYIFGSASAIIMGAGMSLVMTDIGSMLGLTGTLVPGILVGIVGMGMALSTYPIYQKILNARRKKFAPQIMELSDRIMKG